MSPGRAAARLASEMRGYIVERYEPGLSKERLRDDTRRLSEAVAALQREGGDIELLGVTLTPGDESVFEKFRSDGAELIGLAHERASVSYERIVEAVAIEVDGDPDMTKHNTGGSL